MEQTMTSITRRSLTLGLGASAVLAAVPGRAVAKPPPQKAMLLSMARRKVGAITVTALSDGYIEVPFGVFTGRLHQRSKRPFPAVSPGIQTACTASALRSGLSTLGL
jgi:hypothetical protein